MGDTVFLICMSAPVIFFIYSIVSYKNKFIIYTIKDKNMKVVNDAYYSLQLSFCIINSILVALGIFILYNSKNATSIVFYYLAVFWILNYLLKFMAIKKNYIRIDCE